MYAPVVMYKPPPKNPRDLTVTQEVKEGVEEVVVKVGQLVILVCKHRVRPAWHKLHLQGTARHSMAQRVICIR